MTFKLSTRWIAFGAFIALIVLILIVDRVEDVATHISYPLDTWRMDMDDAVVAMGSLGTLLLGIAAFSALWIKADRAHRKADQATDQINGGMTSLASQIITDELRTADLEVGLHKQVKVQDERLVALEKLTSDCLEREQVWEKEKVQLRKDRLALRDWLNHRLDRSGQGREVERD